MKKINTIEEFQDALILGKEFYTALYTIDKGKIRPDGIKCFNQYIFSEDRIEDFKARCNNVPDTVFGRLYCCDLVQ